MHSCNGDGKILRPERPLTLLDAAFPTGSQDKGRRYIGERVNGSRYTGEQLALKPAHWSAKKDAASSRIETLWGTYSTFELGGARTAYHYVFFGGFRYAPLSPPPPPTHASLHMPPPPLPTCSPAALLPLLTTSSSAGSANASRCR